MTFRVGMKKRDVFEIWRIDPHAFKYFGIIVFTDLPGFFPMLARQPNPED